MENNSISKEKSVYQLHIECNFSSGEVKFGCAKDGRPINLNTATNDEINSMKMILSIVSSEILNTDKCIN